MRYFETEEKRKIILLYPEFKEKFSYFFESEEEIFIFIKTINLNLELFKKS
jgi:hypothetical protein